MQAFIHSRRHYHAACMHWEIEKPEKPKLACNKRGSCPDERAMQKLKKMVHASNALHFYMAFCFALLIVYGASGLTQAILSLE